MQYLKSEQEVRELKVDTVVLFYYYIADFGLYASYRRCLLHIKKKKVRETMKAWCKDQIVSLTCKW